jgi:hypothetical protein
VNGVIHGTGTAGRGWIYFNHQVGSLRWIFNVRQVVRPGPLHHHLTRAGAGADRAVVGPAPRLYAAASVTPVSVSLTTRSADRSPFAVNVDEPVFQVRSTGSRVVPGCFCQ